MPPTVCRDVQSIEAEIATRRPLTLTPDEWLMAGDFVREMTRLLFPYDANNARAYMALLARYLLISSVWDGSKPPRREEVFATEQARYVDTRLLRQGKSAWTRKTMRRIASKLGPNPPVTKGREGSAETPVLLTVNPVLARGASALTIRSWLVPRLDGPTDIPALDRALRDEAGRTGLTNRFFDSAQPHLTIRSHLDYVPELVCAVVPVGRHSKPDEAVVPKRPSRAAVKRAQKAKLAGHSTRQTVTSAPADVGAAILAYTPRIPSGEWRQVRDVTRDFVAAAEPVSVLSARQLMWIVTRYALWAQTHTGASTISVDVLADLDASRRYVTTKLTSSKSTVETRRSTLDAAIRTICDGRLPTAGYRTGAAPYTRGEEQRLTLLARHQKTSLRQARLGIIIALGAGAGLNSAEIRRIAPHDITVQESHGFSFLQVKVGGTRPRTVPLRDTYRSLLTDSLNLHDSNGFTRHDPIMGNPDNNNAISMLCERCKTADGPQANVSVNRLRATWLLAVANSRIPLTALLAAAGLKSARPIADLIPFMEESDPAEYAAEYAAIIAGAPE
jgi:integrase